GAKRTTRNTASKAQSTGRSTASRAQSTARRAGPKRQNSGGSRSTRSRSTRSRSTTSSARSRQQGARQQVGEMNKTQLVERLGRHLNKLKGDDLVSLVERVESKTLDLSTLTLSGDGGFGFQEGAPEAGSGEGGS